MSAYSIWGQSKNSECPFSTIFSMPENVAQGLLVIVLRRRQLSGWIKISISSCQIKSELLQLNDFSLLVSSMILTLLRLM